MNPDKLIDQLETIIDLRDDGDETYIQRVHPLMDEIIKLKPETLSRSQQEKLQMVLDKLDNAQEAVFE